MRQLLSYSLHLLHKLPAMRMHQHSERSNQPNMYIFIFFFLFFNPNFASSSSSPDRYIKSLKSSHHHRTSQEYVELAQPVFSDLLMPSCSLPILKHSFGNTVGSPPFAIPYSPPSDCPTPWARIILEFRASCRGEQYDRIAGLWLGGVEILRTSTAEPTENGIFWNIRKDVTRYSSLFARPNIELTMMLENVVNEVFTGVYHVNVSLFYYKEMSARVPSSVVDNQELNRNLGFGSEKLPQNSVFVSEESVGGANMLQGSWSLYEQPADLIIPISNDRDEGFWFRIKSKSDVHSKSIRIPCNTRRAVLEMYVSFHGNDEFWYSNPPDSYMRMNNITTGRGNGAFREVYLTIDGEFVASVVPFPVIFTGGINPLFWEPVVAIGAFHLPSYEFDLSPFLGNILDGKSHSYAIGVSDSIPFWLVDANLHLWLDYGSSKLQSKSTVINRTPNFSVQRRSRFNGLDGSFKIMARRTTQIVGWVNSREGNLTTHVSQEFKYKNSINFQGNGAHKSVQQKIKTKTEVRVHSGAGTLLTHAVLRRSYPITIITATVPRTDKDTYLAVTNVSHSMLERFSNRDYSSLVYNSQDSGGWMMVKDHSVLAGEASTRQRLSYRDVYSCYSRIVAATEGQLIRDNSTYSCANSA